MKFRIDGEAERAEPGGDLGPRLGGRGHGRGGLAAVGVLPSLLGLSSSRSSDDSGGIATAPGRRRPAGGRARRGIAGGLAALGGLARSWFTGRRSGGDAALAEVEAALRRSETEARKLAMVAQKTDNAVIITDAGGRIEWVNDGFTRITGYSLDEVVGRKPGQFLQGPGTDRETVARMRARINRGEGFVGEVINYSKSGRLYWLSIDLQPIRDELGTLTHFIAIESDLTERKQAEIALRLSHDELEARVAERTAELVAAYDATIGGWSRALDLRDRETEGHSRRVTEMSMRLARAMSVPEADLADMRRGAMLHDIGKMGIPDAILLKPGKLTEEEWEVMRRHPSYAHEWLRPIAFLRKALEIPRSHHEKWDGSGYPDGLAREQIPLAARIFAAVDIWDALRSDRPYRAGWPEGRVIEHIRTLAGAHLDPAVVTAFLDVLAEDRAGVGVGDLAVC